MAISSISNHVITIMGVGFIIILCKNALINIALMNIDSNINPICCTTILAILTPATPRIDNNTGVTQWCRHSLSKWNWGTQVLILIWNMIVA